MCIKRHLIKIKTQTMKTIISKLIALFLIVTVTTSCTVDMLNRVNGNRNVTTEKRKIKNDFSVVKVSTGLDLYITQGDRVSLTVEADENLHDIIKTEVNENGKLSIYSEKNIWKAKARKVHLTVTNLQELIATSGSDVYSENTLKVDDLKVSVTSGADANIKVDANNVETISTSGADLAISGSAKNHISRATSGASIKAYNLESKTVTAKATSGADIDVYVSENINATATSGGDIDYKGNPKTITKKETSGGDVDAK